MNHYIDHTLLKADARETAIIQLCQEAKEYNFASVCINPCWVALAHRHLEASSVKVCTVIGFPLGATSTQAKVFETKQAVQDGADEFDMVINIARLKDRDVAYVEDEIRAIVKAAEGKIVKVIIETALLSEDEKRLACQCVLNAKAHFVKTSTGFSTAGATIADVALMKSVVGDNALVKAAGGVRSLEDMKAMIAAGASRIGTSSGVALMKGLSADQSY